MEKRYSIAGFDIEANHQLAVTLSDLGYVTHQNEFQIALYQDLPRNRFKWLNLFLDVEKTYLQHLIVLWFDTEIWAKTGVKYFSNLQLLENAKAILPDRSAKVYDKTRVFFVQMSQKNRYGLLAALIKESLEKSNIPTSDAPGENLKWDLPFNLFELIWI